MTAGDSNELVFLPLGGAGEIGMNLNLYGYGSPGAYRWLMIDCGIAFGGDGIPGADVLMPDPAFIVERRDCLEGILLTHAHEDHLGAIPYLWSELRCPVYATPFAQTILNRKLSETGLEDQLRPVCVPDGGPLAIGPFSLSLIGMTHSIPEAQAVVIRTEAGIVLHTGDWKLDPNPVIGPRSDEDALAALGDEGVAALICDSTNVFEEGSTGSEGTLHEALYRLIAERRRRIVVTCFATNIARLRTIAGVAQACDRVVVMSGASLKRNYVAARECGYLTDVAPFLDDSLIDRLPREKTLVLCTGGQGEPRAALSRIARGDHPSITLQADDAVIFSSRVIPGNEAAIARLYNALLRQGIDVVTHRHGPIHVSGHPAQDDLRSMYGFIRPQAAIPVHGELRHLLEHARVARAEGVEQVIVVENGALVRLAPGPAAIIDRVHTGKLPLEGNRTVRIDGELVRSRSKAIYNGAVTVTVVLEAVAPRVRDIALSSIGLIEAGEDDIVGVLHGAVRKSVESLSAHRYEEDGAIVEAVRTAVRRGSRQAIGKHPVVQVHVVRV